MLQCFSTVCCDLDRTMLLHYGNPDTPRWEMRFTFSSKQNRYLCLYNFVSSKQQFHRHHYRSNKLAYLPSRTNFPRNWKAFSHFSCRTLSGIRYLVVKSVQTPLFSERFRYGSCVAFLVSQFRGLFCSNLSNIRPRKICKILAVATIYTTLNPAWWASRPRTRNCSIQCTCLVSSSALQVKVG